MEWWFEILAAVGPLAVLVIAGLLHLARRLVKPKVAQITTEGHGEAPGASGDDCIAPLSAPFVPVAPVTREPSDVEKAMQRAVDDADAGRPAGSSNRTLVEINPDGTTVVSPLPDPLTPPPGSKQVNPDVTIRDATPLPNERLPGDIYRTRQTDGYSLPGGITAHPITAEEVTARVDSYALYQTNVKAAGDNAFAQVLPEIEAEARALAMKMVERQERKDLIARDAAERNIIFEQAREEFIEEVVLDAKEKAIAAYRSNVLVKALSWGEIMARGIFSYDDSGERPAQTSVPQVLKARE